MVLTTEEIIGAQNFNFAPKFSQNGSFQPKLFIFGRDDNFCEKKLFAQFSDSPKFRRDEIIPPLCHDVTACARAISPTIYSRRARTFSPECNWKRRIFHCHEQTLFNKSRIRILVRVDTKLDLTKPPGTECWKEKGNRT